MRRFYFELARELGMPVSTMLATVSHREIMEWHAFFTIEEEALKVGTLVASAQAGVMKIKTRRRR